MEHKTMKSSNASLGAGGTIIVVIFVVVCLTVFASLSFVTAISDLKLAKKTEEINYDYYDTHGKAEEKLSDIFGMLDSISDSHLTSEHFYDSASDLLSEIEGISAIEKNNSSLKIYYETLGTKNQKICVTLNIFYDELIGQPRYDIETWNLTAIELPVFEEQNIDLWKGLE
ncbi:MAG TPA: hypothetical protein DC038_02535 [Clostridiales bacterium]|nr:hypothetical protein [Clostridiales bacterium]